MGLPDLPGFEWILAHLCFVFSQRSLNALPSLQGRPITPVYAMAHNIQRIPTAAAAGLYGAGYGASYMPIAAPNTATLAALQKNAAVAAAAYGGYAGYMPQAFPTAAFQVPIHDIYQTY